MEASLSGDIDGMLVLGIIWGISADVLGITGQQGRAEFKSAAFVKGHSVLDVGSGATLLTSIGPLC